MHRMEMAPDEERGAKMHQKNKQKKGMTQYASRTRAGRELRMMAKHGVKKRRCSVLFLLQRQLSNQIAPWHKPVVSFAAATVTAVTIATKYKVALSK